MKIAVVGAGIAGLGAAHALVRAGHDVTLYEASPKAGGHVHTVAADGHAIDMGFIVCNRENYPGLFALFAELGVTTRPTTMSFSVSPGASGSGPALFDWSTSAPFADRRALASPRHWWLLGQVTAFLSRARQDVALATRSPSHAQATRRSLGDYLDRIGASAELREQFVIPLVSALWSMAWDRCLEFPAISFLRFLDHHGMLRLVRPLTWHTVVGGSRTYVDALLAMLARSGRFTLRLSTTVTRIDRTAAGVGVTTESSSIPTSAGAGASLRAAAASDHFDRVVIASAADIALGMLATPTADEQHVLGAFTYAANHTVLHTDRRFLPAAPGAHAAWNVVRDGDRGRVAVTYSMTKLQGLPDAPYLVTLNPRTRPAGVLHEVAFRHPQFDGAALRAQAALPTLSGGDTRTYFAGAYAGNGFHEHGLQSGALAAERLLADAARTMPREAVAR